jgi:hypothetical protein
MSDKDEKDRLGDTLHRKKRGDEERYFAELDRKRLARLREQAGYGAEHCPRCGRPLVSPGRAPTPETCDGGCTG